MARTEPVDAAIAAYQRAVAQNPNDLEGRWKLLRAYRYKGAYVARSNAEKRQVYGEAIKAGEGAMALTKRLLAMDKTNERQVAEAARKVPGAAEVLLWDAINWGEWALAYGKMAAARQGVGERIRRQATIANLFDPRLEGGAPSRVLGRLHSETPRVPFLTGWASKNEAVKFLNESLKIDPTNKITFVFLAEAMVDKDPAAKPQAIAMLRKAVTAPNHPDYPVEQAAAQADAAALLRKWGGGSPSER